MQTVFFKNDIDNAIDVNLIFLKKFLNSYKYGLGIQNLQKIKFEKQSENSVFAIFCDHFIKCEAISPGSSDIFFDLISSNPEKKEVQIKTAESLSKDNLKKMLKTFSTDTISEIVFEALHLAGLKGKVALSISESNFNQDVLEFNTGSFFSDVNVAFDLKSTKFLDAKIACIDGYVESVSEIHRILEDAASSKETLIMFLRGLSDDVAHTLKVNYDRGTLRVIPVISKFDVDGSNLLNDIAVVSGCDVFSNLKGNLFSSVDISSLPRVDSIDISSSGVLIENHLTNSAVDRHILFLQKKIQSSDNQTSIDALTKRVQRLGTNRVVIKLSDNQEKLKKSYMIDRSLRAVKLASNYGVIGYKEKYYPNSSFKIAEIYAKKFQESIKNLGAILI